MSFITARPVLYDSVRAFRKSHSRLTAAWRFSCVIPADAGIQSFQNLMNYLDPGLRRGDGQMNWYFILRLTLECQTAVFTFPAGIP